MDASKLVRDVKEIFHKLVDNVSVATESDIAQLREDIDSIGEDAKETASDAATAVEKTVNETVSAPAGTGDESVDPPGVTSPKDQPAETPDPLAGLTDAQIRELAAKQMQGAS